ncbi:MAG TPA: hypothetical protein VNP97_13260 [Microbacterium sp.]|jgi:hypothetical protein|nr:hypothetical protein [Microbacterium sp.]
MIKTVAASAPGCLELLRIDADHWIIQDDAYPASDARHVVACVYETDDGDFEVVWLSAEVPLPTYYRNAGDVLEDLARWRGHTHGRPVEIAHFPPLRTRPRAAQAGRNIEAPRRLTRSNRT